jgi:AmmeMemoRadiSam system protein B
VRLAAGFAGSFYPGRPEELLRQVDDYLASATAAATVASTPRGGIVPHAGYVYSGLCAAHVYSRLANDPPEIVVLMGPSHRVAVDGAVAFDLEAFETPLGPVASNAALAAELSRAVDGLDLGAPFAEHSLEVQLPFLRRVAPKCEVVAVAFGFPELAISRRLGEALHDLASRESVFVLASSDLSHFHARPAARRLDEQFASRVAALQIEELWEDLRSRRSEACGVGPVLSLLCYAREVGAHMELLDLRDSGDVSGDTDEVVGYLAAVATRVDAA